MERINERDIIKYLKESSEPINGRYGIAYLASTYLVDGTFLPCVAFCNSEPIVNLAIRRFKEEQAGKGVFGNSKMAYYQIVKTFVAGGNCINAYDISKVEKSRFAFSQRVLCQIHGETTMGWTGFVGKMKDGACFGFGSTFNFEFFEMPDGYQADDITEIINHSYIDNAGEIKSYHSVALESIDATRLNVYRERPFFTCYLDGL